MTAASRARHSRVSIVRARTWALSRSDRPGIRRAIFAASSARTSSSSSSARQAVGGGGAQRDWPPPRRASPARLLGQIMQHIGAGIGPGRQLGGAALHLLAGADVQDIERVARIEARARAGRKAVGWSISRPVPSEARILAQAALTAFKEAWWTRVNGPCATPPPRAMFAAMERLHIAENDTPADQRPGFPAMSAAGFSTWTTRCTAPTTASSPRSKRA